ncbi:hypothetical protein BRADI_5g02068v3 [Brachypodium distachyon]|uniref:Reverse transcriptase zinc-binding domain-containing protein n=1 Tax=Brachypodium distachyon TaxID=15368 RepID=A0A2K2CEZ9_BRADI|nr:hypothetical protein BRADI_5g02068v3 [Brachypodium distachyon]
MADLSSFGRTNGLLLTRDNLCKHQHLNDTSCLLCCEPKSVNHLFFSCDIIKLMWHDISIMLNIPAVLCYEDIAKMWVNNTKLAVANMVTSVFMWMVWKFRNDVHFGRILWSGLQVLWHRLFRLLVRWKLLCPKNLVPLLENFLTLLDCKVREAPQIRVC